MPDPDMRGLRPVAGMRGGLHLGVCEEDGGVMPRRFRRVVEVVVYQVMTVENSTPWPCESRVLEPGRPDALATPRAPWLKSKPPWWR
jgi:hypothetical protein